MHQMREANAARMSPFTAEDIKAFDRACPPSVSRDIAMRGGIPGPSMAGQDGQITAVRGPSGLPGSGWVAPRAMGPVPGYQHIDRIVAAQDRLDRAELAEKMAKAQAVEQAMKKAAGE
jgi:hypothetical protein